MRFLRRLAAPEYPNSFGNRMRRRRFELFTGLLDRIGTPVRILDVGGREGFWRQMGFADAEGVEIVLVNLERQRTDRPNFRCTTGDARSMPQFEDDEFDVAFSNSVIEHVGDWRDQGEMAREVMRIGRSFFVQTPNHRFPVEPHYLAPGFQFLPIGVRAGLIQRFSLGHVERIPDAEAARAHVERIRLLRREEVRELFPGATIYEERLLGLTKSFVAYGGSWQRR